MKPAKIIVPVLLICAFGTNRLQAEGIWSLTEEYCASATANLFDGGPPVSQEGCVAHDGVGVAISARDYSQQPGSLGATATAFVRSSGIVLGDTLDINVELVARYDPSFLPGGDNPGGMAEAQFSDVIEFVMPADNIPWFYNLDIDDMYGPPFTGSTNILIENVTRSEILLDADAELPNTNTVLQGTAGDIIRITSDMFGSGTMGPGSVREYQSVLRMRFTIPEPQTIYLLSLGALFAPRMRRSRTRHRTL